MSQLLPCCEILRLSQQSSFCKLHVNFTNNERKLWTLACLLNATKCIFSAFSILLRINPCNVTKLLPVVSLLSWCSSTLHKGLASDCNDVVLPLQMNAGHNSRSYFQPIVLFGIQLLLGNVTKAVDKLMVRRKLLWLLWKILYKDKQTMLFISLFAWFCSTSVAGFYYFNLY